MKRKTYLTLLSTLIALNVSIVTIALNVLTINSYTIYPFIFGVAVLGIIFVLLAIRLDSYYRANKIVSNKAKTESDEAYVLRQFSVI